MPRYTFGPFELDLEARLLRRDGEPVPIAGKTLDTLILLVESHGWLVDKEELLSRVWVGCVVEEANLTQAIFTIRKVLGDSPKDHRYIATVAGRGYQFVAPVTEVTTRMGPGRNDLNKLRGGLSVFWHRNRGFQLGIAGITIAFLAGAIALWRPSHSRSGGMPGTLTLSRFTSVPGV